VNLFARVTQEQSLFSLMTFTGMYLEKGSNEGVEEYGEELSICFTKLFIQTINSKKKERKDFSITFKDYVWNAFNSLMKYSKKAAIKMSEEGMFEQVAKKARESCDNYFYILQTTDEKQDPSCEETVKLL
jgi:hypothetical protein